MSKLSTLKEQNTNMNIGVIDALSILFEKTKYVELTLNLHKQNFHKRIHKDHIKNSYTTTLVDMGFENVAHVGGGFDALKQSGIEIVSKEKK